MRFFFRFDFEDWLLTLNKDIWSWEEPGITIYSLAKKKQDEKAT